MPLWFGQEVQEVSRTLKLPQAAEDTPSIEGLKVALKHLPPKTLPLWVSLGATGMLRHHTAHHFGQFGLLWFTEWHRAGL